MKRTADILLPTMFLASALTVACSNDTSPLANPPNTGCASVAPPMLLYPQNGATGIPTAHLTLYFANVAPAFAPPVLTPSGGSGALTGTPYSSPSPAPTPPGMATPPPGASVVISQFNPAVASATTYTVTVTNSICSQTFTEGTFTTQ
ncbi:MAG: hypothetical protein JO165_09635 [Candidatus Eremiobacteraeota bacterium]|nr:hypothetical protein [Candidatus Eremiobacteraeota bacterium]